MSVTFRYHARLGLAPIHIVAVAAMGLAALPSAAQTTAERPTLAHCASISDDTARLACYDALAAAAGLSADTSAPIPQSPDQTPPASSAASGIDAFGVEQVEERGFEIPDEIQSRLIGTFRGWRGNTVFRLENGQVWRQSEQDRLVYRAVAPLITIRRGSFGTYRLSVEGINSSVRVRRIE